MGLKEEAAAQVGWESLQLSSHDLARESVVGELVLVGGRGFPMRREGWMAVRVGRGALEDGGRQSSRVSSSVVSEGGGSSLGVEIDVDGDK